jgi:hypothetical protein
MGIWNGVQFTLDPVSECDYFVMLNNRKFDAVKVRCPRENVWVLMQEPYVPFLYDWLIDRDEPYARVLTHLAPERRGKYMPSHPAIPWWTGLGYDELVATPIPAKTGGVSWITSNLKLLPGHRLRNSLREHLMDACPGAIDIYGQGIRPVPRKWEGLAPYKYSIAFENASGPHLWTEKIADCFLSWTLPLYYGCTNLEDYFPAESFIRIDPRDRDAVAALVRQAPASGEWEKRLPALEAARDLVLRRYALFPHLANLIQEHRAQAGPMEPREEVTIPGYRWRRFRDMARYIVHRYVTHRVPAAEELDLETMIGDSWRRLKHWDWEKN